LVLPWAAIKQVTRELVTREPTGSRDSSREN